MGGFLVDLLISLLVMAHVINKLSAAKVKNAGPGLHGDGANLYLQVSPTGGKSWSFRFMLNRRVREMGLGPLHIVSLAEARTKAAAMRQMLLDGVDPIEMRQQTRKKVTLEAASATTFETVAQAYIKAHEAGWSNEKHAKQWKATLETYVYPVFGALAVSSIDLSLVTKVLEPIWKQKPETASRVRGRIEAVLDYATTKGWRTGDNPARWRGYLENLFPATGKISRVQHHGALACAEMPAFIKELKAQQGLAANALLLTVLTATRTGDVIGARWEEVDMAQRVWTVPAARIKGRRRDHRIPLSGTAVALLKRAMPQRDAGEVLAGFVYPGGKAGRGLSNMALLAVLKRMQCRGVTTHGFRSTFRDWAAEQTDYRPEIVESALAHVVSNKVEAAYKRTDFFDLRRQLMADWADFCEGRPPGGKLGQSDPADD
ncbi:tyrosine-type recombinase/integrase [Acidocella aquatica]|nr:integrase arm-type DNA-binding domain-containing protein [Acidocella aquatica]